MIAEKGGLIEIKALNTKQGEVYQYKDIMVMRCSGTSKPRFVDIHTGELLLLNYNTRVAKLKQTSPAKFRYVYR